METKIDPCETPKLYLENHWKEYEKETKKYIENLLSRFHITSLLSYPMKILQNLWHDLKNFGKKSLNLFLVLKSESMAIKLRLLIDKNWKRTLISEDESNRRNN